jgi:hypothetical protein
MNFNPATGEESRGPLTDAITQPNDVDNEDTLLPPDNEDREDDRDRDIPIENSVHNLKSNDGLFSERTFFSDHNT